MPTVMMPVEKCMVQALKKSHEDEAKTAMLLQPVRIDSVWERNKVQQWTFAYVWLLNKPYEKEVALTEQTRLKGFSPYHGLVSLRLSEMFYYNQKTNAND